MTTYFDTNVLLYGFAKNSDDVEQSIISAKLIEDAIIDNSLIVSGVALCEFAYVSYKIKEYKNTIDSNLDFLSDFLQPEPYDIYKRVLQIFKNEGLYIGSFDVYHLAFAEYYGAKLVTFDKGFKKLQAISNIEIEIL